MMVCRYCSVTLSGAQRLLCGSDECVRAYKRDHARKWRAENSERAKRLRRESMKRWRGANLDVARERERAWRDANQDWVSDYDKRRWHSDPERRSQSARRARAWKDANPDRVREQGRKDASKRRARMRGVEIEEFDPFEVFERDNWVCGICGDQVEPDTRWPDSASVTIDHIVPIVEGGSHTRANTRCAHLGCNSSRRDRGGNEQLILVSL